MGSQNSGLPIVELRVRGMEHSMAMALTEYEVQMDEMLQEAVKKYCAPENLKRIINEETERVIDAAVKDAVRYWFTGTEEGKAVIRKAVADKLEEESKIWRDDDRR